MAQGKVSVAGLMVSVDRQEMGPGGRTTALREIEETYGFSARSIVTMEEVVACLSETEIEGRKVIGEAEREAIEGYYRTYGCKEP